MTQVNFTSFTDVFRHAGHSLQHPRFKIKLENLYGNHMKFRKKMGKYYHCQQKIPIIVHMFII